MNTVTDSCLSSASIIEKSNTINISIELSNLESIKRNEKTLKNLRMNYESERLKTFNNWPLVFISVWDLAKNGLYYTGIGDRVKCNYCHIILCEWEPNDNVEADHKKHSPRCPFYSGKVFNIPIKKTENTIKFHPCFGHDYCLSNI